MSSPTKIGGTPPGSLPPSRPVPPRDLKLDGSALSETDALSLRAWPVPKSAEEARWQRGFQEVKATVVVVWYTHPGETPERAPRSLVIVLS